MLSRVLSRTWRTATSHLSRTTSRVGSRQVKRSLHVRNNAQKLSGPLTKKLIISGLFGASAVSAKNIWNYFYLFFYRIIAINLANINKNASFMLPVPLLQKTKSRKMTRSKTILTFSWPTRTTKRKQTKQTKERRIKRRKRRKRKTRIRRKSPSATVKRRQCQRMLLKVKNQIPLISLRISVKTRRSTEFCDTST